jgi:hypothetical protein
VNCTEQYKREDEGGDGCLAQDCSVGCARGRQDEFDQFLCDRVLLGHLRSDHRKHAAQDDQVPTSSLCYRYCRYCRNGTYLSLPGPACAARISFSCLGFHLHSMVRSLLVSCAADLFAGRILEIIEKLFSRGAWICPCI